MRKCPFGLPALAFGEAGAQTIQSVQLAGDLTAKALPALEAFDSRTADFRYKSAGLSINGLQIFATALTPTHTRYGAHKKLVLGIAFAGSAVGRCDGKDLSARASNLSFMCSEADQVAWNGETRSMLTVQFDQNRLKATMSAICGLDVEDDVDLELPRALAMQAGAFDFTKVFNNICIFIESFSGDVALMEKLVLDDLFYRQAVFLLKPELLASRERVSETRAPNWRHGIDAVCDAIRCHLDQRLSLTEMEAISGLSRRSLQYAFRKRFGLSPMEWHRRERLHVAYKRLCNGDRSVTIAELSMLSGFGSPSSFAAHYRRIFGETPSETLGRARDLAAGRML